MQVATYNLLNYPACFWVFSMAFLPSIWGWLRGLGGCCQISGSIKHRVQRAGRRLTSRASFAETETYDELRLEAVARSRLYLDPGQG